MYENLAEHSEELGLIDKAIKYKACSSVKTLQRLIQRLHLHLFLSAFRISIPLAINSIALTRAQFETDWQFQELQLGALSEVVEFVLSPTITPWMVADQQLRRLREIAGKKKASKTKSNDNEFDG